MDIIGFIAALLFSIYLCLAGVATLSIESSLTGKMGYAGFVILLTGLIVLYLSFEYAPFTVSFNAPKE